METVRKTRDRGRRPAQSGTVSVIVLVIAALLALTGVSLLSLSQGSYRRALYAAREIAARSAAEAGVAQAWSAMKSWDGVHYPSATNVAVPGCPNVTFTYTTAAGTPSGYDLVATGQAGDATKTIHAHLACENSYFRGLVINETAVIKTSAKVLPAAGSVNPTLVTNSTVGNAINLDTSITFTGNAVVGPSGNPASVIKNEQMVSGSLSAAAAATTFSPVTPPTGLPTRSNITTTTTLTQDFQCGRIDMHGTTLTISGNRTLYVTGSPSITIDHAASIYITSGSSLTLYVAGTVTMNKVTVTSADADPRRLQILGTPTCTSVSIENTTTFYGTVYAPQAAAQLLSGATVYGAIASKKINSIEAQSKLYYDDRVLASQVPGAAGTYSLTYWQDN